MTWRDWSVQSAQAGWHSEFGVSKVCKQDDMISLECPKCAGRMTWWVWSVQSAQAGWHDGVGVSKVCRQTLCKSMAIDQFGALFIISDRFRRTVCHSRRTRGYGRNWCIQIFLSKLCRNMIIWSIWIELVYFLEYPTGFDELHVILGVRVVMNEISVFIFFCRNCSEIW